MGKSRFFEVLRREEEEDCEGEREREREQRNLHLELHIARPRQRERERGEERRKKGGRGISCPAGFGLFGDRARAAVIFDFVL